MQIVIILRKILNTTLSSESKAGATNANSLAFLLHTSKALFGTNFRHQNKNNVVKTISCFVCRLSKKYYMSEHLKYCTQTNEY